jgi:hypothetical protein
MSEPAEEKAINTKFKVSVDTLKKLVDSYRQREFDDDLKMIKGEFGGVEGLAEKLYTNLKKGITPIDLEERDLVYGTNAKDPLKVTGF